MYQKGMVTGSFDPITLGHQWMVARACKLFDDVYFAIAYNSNKQGLFTADERSVLVDRVLSCSLAPNHYKKIKIVKVDQEFTVSVAKELGVNTIMRGIRNSKDFEYEKDIQGFNADIEPAIDHVFVLPPEDMTRISSSAIKAFMGTKNWEAKVARYVHPLVLHELKRKQAQKTGK
jgi:pantetheine-phosphate adenylyltransferase